jgi:hypothetical protein
MSPSMKVLSKSKQDSTKEVYEEENEVTRVPEAKAIEPKEVIHEDNDMEEPQRSAKMSSHKRRPSWAQELIGDVETYGAPEKYIRESNKSKLYSNYVACLFDIMDVEPSSYEENT